VLGPSPGLPNRFRVVLETAAATSRRGSGKNGRRPGDGRRRPKMRSVSRPSQLLDELVVANAEMWEAEVWIGLPRGAQPA